MTPHDTEIERPFEVRLFEGRQWVSLDEAARLHEAHQRATLEVVALRNEAALRSQPASEPSLDVGRLGKAMDAVWPSHWEGMGGTGSNVESRSWQIMDPDVPHPNLVKAIAAEYQGLSQPADNEAAETAPDFGLQAFTRGFDGAGTDQE